MSEENRIGSIVIDAAIGVHRELGPGLLESVYEIVLLHELRRRDLQAQRQVPVAIEYQGMQFDEGFLADIVVEGKVILELKSIENVHASHKKQLLTYLKLSRMRLGYLLNFGAETMKQGITRMVNNLDE
ncbi:GxxExxY protein [Desulfonatronovibrio magnus]|uniref:GxxExxY protein n=1 Tax=Desulfonatronovibrio magnus TaxID=698827 RepID=UPI0005EB0DD8|nr:GxxExxY protein [Desulfonatronovibrio magnus]